MSWGQNIWFHYYGNRSYFNIMKLCWLMVNHWIVLEQPVTLARVCQWGWQERGVWQNRLLQRCPLPSLMTPLLKWMRPSLQFWVSLHLSQHWVCQLVLPTALLTWRYRTMVSRALYTCMSLFIYSNCRPVIRLVQITCQLHASPSWAGALNIKMNRQVRTGPQNFGFANVLVEDLSLEHHSSSVALGRQHPDVTRQPQATGLAANTRTCWY